MSAPFDILSALERIVAVQEGLTITSPSRESVARVHLLPPDRNKTLADIPCFINTARLHPTQFGASLLQRRYTVRMQFFAGPPTNHSALVAMAFEEKLIRAFAADVTLAGACTNLREIRASDGTDGLVRYEWGKVSYFGFDYELDVQFAEGQVYEP